MEFDYLAPIYHVKLKIKPQFQAPNSNTYTLDWIFDFTSSVVTAGGTPIDAGVGIKFYPMTTEPTWRIQCLATLAVDESLTADLFPLSDYWRPLP